MKELVGIVVTATAVAFLAYTMLFAVQVVLPHLLTMVGL